MIWVEVVGGGAVAVGVGDGGWWQWVSKGGWWLGGGGCGNGCGSVGLAMVAWRCLVVFVVVRVSLARGLVLAWRWWLGSV